MSEPKQTVISEAKYLLNFDIRSLAVNRLGLIMSEPVYHQVVSQVLAPAEFKQIEPKIQSLLSELSVIEENRK